MLWEMWHQTMDFQLKSYNCIPIWNMNSMSGVKLRKYILFGINTVYLLILPITDASVQKKPNRNSNHVLHTNQQDVKFFILRNFKKRKVKKYCISATHYIVVIYNIVVLFFYWLTSTTKDLQRYSFTKSETVLYKRDKPPLFCPSSLDEFYDLGTLPEF